MSGLTVVYVFVSSVFLVLQFSVVLPLSGSFDLQASFPDELGVVVFGWALRCAALRALYYIYWLVGVRVKWPDPPDQSAESGELLRRFLVVAVC